MDLQKINWKIFVTDPKTAEPDTFFKVFNSWISDSPEIFVDVADYQHAHDGPVTALVGHYLDYWLDDTDRRRGLLYHRRKPMEGTNEEKLRTALVDLLKAGRRLESDPAFHGALKFSTGEFQIIINDRAVAPNTRETLEAVRPDLDRVLMQAFGGKDFSLKQDGDPRRRFSVTITGRTNPTLDSLLQRLGG